MRALMRTFMRAFMRALMRNSVFLSDLRVLCDLHVFSLKRYF